MRIIVPSILSKAKRAAFWSWLGFLACMISAAGARHFDYETTSTIFSGGMMLFGISFGFCVLLTFVLICAAIVRLIIRRGRNV
jgi:uncharacterized membrane protein YhaH (DUF805 family)